MERPLGPHEITKATATIGRSSLQQCDCRKLAIFDLQMKTATDTELLLDEDVLTKTVDPFQLIVWNDDVNTFEWVIETLVEICGHTYEQAEQCAYIIHFNGKYAVKEGSYEDLRPKCDAILERGINATVEVTA